MKKTIIICLTLTVIILSALSIFSPFVAYSGEYILKQGEYSQFINISYSDAQYLVKMSYKHNEESYIIFYSHADRNTINGGVLDNEFISENGLESISMCFFDNSILLEIDGDKFDGETDFFRINRFDRTGISIRLILIIVAWVLSIAVIIVLIKYSQTTRIISYAVMSGIIISCCIIGHNRICYSNYKSTGSEALQMTSVVCNDKNIVTLYNSDSMLIYNYLDGGYEFSAAKQNLGKISVLICIENIVDYEKCIVYFDNPGNIISYCNVELTDYQDNITRDTIRLFPDMKASIAKLLIKTLWLVYMIPLAITIIRWNFRRYGMKNIVEQNTPEENIL